MNDSDIPYCNKVEETFQIIASITARHIIYCMNGKFSDSLQEQLNEKNNPPLGETQEFELKISNKTDDETYSVTNPRPQPLIWLFS